MDQRQLQYFIPLALTLLGPWLTRHGVSDATATQWINATLAYFCSYIVPGASWAYTAWITRRKARLQATATIPGVQKIVMDTQAGADAVAPKSAEGLPLSDKILSPTEDLAHIASSPMVKAVVLESEAAAKLSPSPAVVGPSVLKGG